MSRSYPLRILPMILFGLLSTIITFTNAAYTLKDSYTPSNFFSQFDFFTDADPTHGYVDYQSQSAAQAANLISTANNQIYMGVDSTSTGSGRGRKSVRITSKAVYNHALILLDLQHMPGNICGVWPAFWTVGPNWPNNGEIDIIEGVNGQVGNSVALHTGAGCSVGGGSGGSGNTSPNTGSAQAIFSGTIKTSNCDVAATNQPTNAGCAITSSDASTYGDGLNAGNGGVYATEWTSNAISVWFFPRSRIPSDITSGNPTPSSWGSPIASFGGGGCTIDNSFRNQQIVFDTTFCGDWAGSVWSSDSMCSGKAATCQDYVTNNPAAFKNAYWAVNSLLVYTAGAGGAPSASPTSSMSISRSMSVPAGSGTASASGTAIGTPIPVPSVSGIPIPPVNSNTGFGTATNGFSSKPSSTSTSTSNAYSNPIPTTSNMYSNPNPIPTTPNTIQPVPTSTPTPIMTTSNGYSNPGIQSPTPIPTTMATSSRGGNNNTPTWPQSSTWTWSWGGNNNRGNTWSRGGGSWGGPPRALAKYAYTGDAVPSMPEHEHVRTEIGHEIDSAIPLGLGLSESGRDENSEVSKRLITPVVRRTVDVNVDVNQHLKRHAGHARRHEHEVEHKVRRYGYAAAAL